MISGRSNIISGRWNLICTLNFNFRHLNSQDLEQRSLQRLPYLRSTLKAQGWRRGVAQHCVGLAVRRLSAVHRRFKDRCSMKIEDLVLDQLNRLHVAATH